MTSQASTLISVVVPKAMSAAKILKFAEDNCGEVAAYQVWEPAFQKPFWYSGKIMKADPVEGQPDEYESWRNKATDLPGVERSRRVTENFAFPDPVAHYMNCLTKVEYLQFREEEDREEELVAAKIMSQREEAARVAEETERLQIAREDERRKIRFQQDEERDNKEQERTRRLRQEEEDRRAVGTRREEERRQQDERRQLDDRRRMPQDDEQELAAMMAQYMAKVPRTGGDPSGLTHDHDDSMLSMLKRILKDKEEKTMVTDSEDEGSCTKANIRADSRTTKWITRSRWHFYPSRAEKLLKPEMEAAWHSELLNVRTTGRLLYDDEERMKTSIEAILRTHALLLLLNTVDTRASAKRHARKLFQGSVDDFFAVSIMTVCGDRRESRRMLIKNMFEARIKQASKEDFCASYEVAWRAVRDKYPIFQGPVQVGGNRRPQTPPRRPFQRDRDQRFQSQYQQYPYQQQPFQQQPYQQQPYQAAMQPAMAHNQPSTTVRPGTGGKT